MDALYKKEVPGYIHNIIGSYLENRTLAFGEDKNETKIDVTCGVPQGSVIGPTLWNIHYDGLLRTQLPPGVEYLTSR